MVFFPFFCPFCTILLVTGGDRGFPAQVVILPVTDACEQKGHRTLSNINSHCTVSNIPSVINTTINHYDMSNQPFKVVQGSFHQGDSRFGYSAGIQCSCNTLVSICYSKFRYPTLWKSQDLDYILTEGDSNFKRLRFTESPFLDQFPKKVFVDDQECGIEFNIVHGEFRSNDIAINFISDELLFRHSGALIILCGYSIAVTFYGREYFVFDSHSRDELGSLCPNGKSVLMRFKSLQDINNYMRQTYNTLHFQILYVDVSIENFESKKETVLANVRRRQANVRKRQRKQRYSKIKGTDKHETLKQKMRETNKKAYDNIKGTEEHETIKQNMRKAYENIKGSEKHETIKENMRKAYENIKGTEKHETLKRNMRKTNKRTYEKMQGTKEHEILKQKKRETMKKAYKNMEGTEKHVLKKAKMRDTSKQIRSVQNKVQHFKELIQNGPYYICVCCNRCLYKRSVVLFKEEKYSVDTEEIICDVIPSYDDNVYICLTCHRKILKKETPCQSVTNKLQLFDFRDHLKNIGKLERILITQRILFRKVAILPKGQFPKLKGAICNIPVETGNVCNVLPRGVDSSGVVFVQLKRKLSHKFPAISEPVRPGILDSLLRFLVENNHLYANTYINLPNIIQLDNENSENIDFEIITPKTIDNNGIQFVDDNCVEQILPYGNKEGEFDNEDPLNSFRTHANETLLVSEIPNMVIDDENTILAPGEGKIPYSLINDEKCEELAHPHLFPTGKFGYHVERDVKLSPSKYFNQRLLNCSQKFASDADYIFFAHQVLQQLNLRSKVNIAMRKVTCNNITAGMLGQDFEQTVKNVIASENAYKFMSTIKGTPAYWKLMLYDVLAMVKQLGMPSYFMTLSCADLRWDELIIIIRRLRGENISREELDNLSYFDKCEDLNSNPVLVARHFQYRVENFFKEIVINGQLGKIVYYAIRVEFQDRGSPHVHCLLWTNDAPKLNADTKQQYIQHVDNAMSANIPDADNPTLRKLVKTYQIHSHSKTCRKYNKDECRFGFGHFFASVPLFLNHCQKTYQMMKKVLFLYNATIF